MVRYLTEKDVQQLLTMPLALELVERASKDRALGRAVDVPRVRTGRSVDVHTLTTSSVVVAIALAGAVDSVRGAATDVRLERGTLVMPKDCRQEQDKARCAADNRAIDFCRNEKDANAVYVCLRANQSPVPCEEKKSARGKTRCERINRIYQPCKGKRGPELGACVDQRRKQERRKK